MRTLPKFGTVAMLLVITLTLAACSTSQTVPPTTETGIPPTTQPVPAVDLSATPAGWVPVDYGDAQVSVPATFFVLYPGCGTVSASSGALVLGAL